jgi:hypothetical protein
MVIADESPIALIMYFLNELWGFKSPARQAARIERLNLNPRTLSTFAFSCRRQTLKANADSLAAGANTKRNYELRTCTEPSRSRSVSKSCITNYELF